METSTQARPFAEGDWACFAGAENWKTEDGISSPVSREVGKWWVIADPNGVEAHWVDEDNDYEEHCWALEVQLPNQAAAMAFLNGLPDTFEPNMFGLLEQ